MKIPHSTNLKREFSMSMTPMIDVVFLLLIFFVCTASFQIVESILPSAIATGGSVSVEVPPELLETELERIVVKVFAGEARPRLLVNGQECESLLRLGELLTAIAEVDRTVPVVLDIDGETQLGLAIDVYDRTRLAGFEKIQFAAKSAP